MRLLAMVLCTGIASLVAASSIAAPAARPPTVGDLMHCLGNQTRFKILREGPEIVVRSTPFDYARSEQEYDKAVVECIVSLGMRGASFEVVPLSELDLNPPFSSQQPSASEALTTVPYDFAPSPLPLPSRLPEIQHNITLDDFNYQPPDFITYRAFAFNATGIGYIPPVAEFWPGDTDCITTHTAESAWQAMMFDNRGGCSTLFGKTYGRRRCSSRPRVKMVQPGELNVIGEMHSFCATDDITKGCAVHVDRTETPCKAA